ncbi:DUF1990 family protein [Microbacterium sp. NPDC091313]
MTTGALTQPDAAEWTAPSVGFRRFEATAAIGSGEQAWRRAVDDVLHWRVKTRSGFRVRPEARASAGARVTAGARPVVEVPVLVWRIREPVEVVSVVETADRVGFAYRTLPGHPIDGEEAFVVHREGDAVRLSIRSLSRPAPAGPWRVAYPLLRVAQVFTRRRYLRALR